MRVISTRALEEGFVLHIGVCVCIEHVNEVVVGFIGDKNLTVFFCLTEFFKELTVGINILVLIEDERACTFIWLTVFVNFVLQMVISPASESDRVDLKLERCSPLTVMQEVCRHEL